MTLQNKRKTVFSGWLTYLETVCSKLYSTTMSGSDLEEVYASGIRITLAVMFSRLAEVQSQPTGPLVESFLEPDELIPVPPVDNDFDALPGGFPIDLFPDPEFPGRFYGECLKFSLIETGPGKVSLSDSGSRKNSGSFFTPDVITSFIAEEVLEPLIKNLDVKEILKLRIIDPSMGTGNFLSASAKYLTGVIKSRLDSQESLFTWDDTARELLVRTLFGVDSDPVAVMISRAYFALLAGVSPDSIKNFHVADSLLDKLPFRRPFDAAVGNPPWVSFGLRNLDGVSDSLQNTYRDRFPNSAEYKISIYAMFMERALELTRKGGFNGFIVPDSWLAGRFFAKLRSFFLEHAAFLDIVLISRDFWEGLSIGRSAIYILRKKDENRDEPAIRGAVVPSPEQLDEFPDRIVPLDVSRIKGRDRNRIVVYPSEESRNFAEKMEDSGDILGNYVRFYSGLIGKRGRKSIVYDEKPEDYTPERYGKLIDTGKSLGRHTLVHKGHYIDHNPDKYKSGYDPDKYLNPKIFVNQTGFDLKSCYDEQGYFCLNNLHIGYALNNNVDLRIFAILLNSSVLNRYYRIMSMEQGRALAQTDIDFLHQLPVGTNEQVYNDMIQLADQHFTLRTEEIEEGQIEHAYHIPAPVHHHFETLISRWYGLLDE